MSASRPHVTQAEIAKRSGVSQAAVSAILSGSTSLNVSEDTRAKVLGLAEKLGYVGRRTPSRSSAESGKWRSALLVETLPTVEIADPWVSSGYETLMGKIVTVTGQQLAGHGVGISVHHLGQNRKALMQWLSDSDIDGVIWHATDKDHALLHWVASRYPLVLINREWSGHLPHDEVGIDQAKNITVAAEHLWEAGHRRIATFGHCPTNSIFQRRIDGYRRFVREKGIRDYVEFQALNDDQDYPAPQKIDDILRLWSELGAEAPTAIIMSDAFALRLLGAARKAGVRVPEDLSIIGIDNTVPCPLMDPPLSSMEEPFDEMCREAVDLLLRRMDNRDTPSRSVQIAPRLVSRESVRRLPGSAINDTLSIST